MNLRVAVLGLLFFFALALRLVHLDAVGELRGDEAMHVGSAYTYAERGTFGPDNWYHPPLKHLLLYGTMKMAGDDATGRRLRNVLFGAATVPLLFLFTRRITRSGTAAAAAALLVATDPLHIHFSRSTFEDIPAAFCLLLGLWFVTMAAEEEAEWPLVAAGGAFGVALALKWYVAPVLVMAIAFTFWRRRADRVRLANAVGALVFLPAAIYLAVFLPWFSRGYALSEWVAMQRDAFRELSQLSAAGFRTALNELSGPGRWFTSHVAVGFGLGGEDGWRKLLLITNNPVVWWTILPALLAMAICAWRERSWRLLGPAVVFGTFYLPLLVVARPIFVYSSLPLLPLGFCAVGWGLTQAMPKRVAVAAMAVFVLSAAFFYPLVTEFPVPDALYRPLFDRVRIMVPQ